MAKRLTVNKTFSIYLFKLGHCYMIVTVQFIVLIDLFHLAT